MKTDYITARAAPHDKNTIESMDTTSGPAPREPQAIGLTRDELRRIVLDILG